MFEISFIHFLHAWWLIFWALFILSIPFPFWAFSSAKLVGTLTSISGNQYLECFASLAAYQAIVSVHYSFAKSSLLVNIQCLHRSINALACWTCTWSLKSSHICQASLKSSDSPPSPEDIFSISSSQDSWCGPLGIWKSFSRFWYPFLSILANSSTKERVLNLPVFPHSWLQFHQLDHKLPPHLISYLW